MFSIVTVTSYRLAVLVDGWKSWVTRKVDPTVTTETAVLSVATNDSSVRLLTPPSESTLA